MATTSQIHANHINSLHSTGPRTPGGKKRSSLNAMRHGFTGQVVVLQESDAPHYKILCANYHHDFAPKGQLECDLVQELADVRWAINRIRAHETNLLSLEAVSENLAIDTGDAEMNSSLAVAESLRRNIQTLATLSIYEQRKLRAFEKTLTRVRELQHERKSLEARDLQDANEFREVFQNEESDWSPAKDGFVCSALDLDYFAQRQTRKNHVIDVRHGRRKAA